MTIDFSQLIIGLAYAGDQQASGNTLSSFMPLILITAVFYLLVLRPQQKKNKEHQQKINNMSRGDEVTTAGGIVGTVVSLEGEQITIEIAKDVRVKINKQYISDVAGKRDEKKEEKKDKKKKVTSEEKVKDQSQ